MWVELLEYRAWTSEPRMTHGACNSETSGEWKFER